jgi:hypothetical protein
MRVRDQRPIIVDQRSIREPDRTRRGKIMERPNTCNGPRSTLSSQPSAKNEAAAPTTNALLPRSDFVISDEWRV